MSRKKPSNGSFYDQIKEGERQWEKTDAQRVSAQKDYAMRTLALFFKNARWFSGFFILMSILSIIMWAAVIISDFFNTHITVALSRGVMGWWVVVSAIVLALASLLFGVCDNYYEDGEDKE